jgi:HrpA-like RNA helicase
MSTAWTVACKDCGRDVTYSDSTRHAASERGQAAPERCADCRNRHRRETSRLGLAYLELEAGRSIPSTGVKAGRLGRIERDARPHTSRTREPEPIRDDEFGIKDEHVAALLDVLATHQIAIVQADTGSGKSTFLPWRLLVPPAPYERDHLTRHGQIVVTQPRIDASSGIPEYVAHRLHASEAGPGMDIGYRNSKATDKSDSANKLVYLTDGTLVNMIRKGELHAISTIVIDEAHERSLRIDLILALLRRELRNYPHLRLLIVSATLEQKTFTEFFAPDHDVAFCPMPSKGTYPVHERWRVGQAIPTSSWPAKMPDEVARVAHEVLRWMELGERPIDIPDDVPAYPGDILCFLPGKRHIAHAIERLCELVDGDADLRDIADRVEVLPLHSELPNRQRRRPLEPTTRSARVKYRVVVSTNLAETSLTIDGIRHVVDSGLNNLKTWDPATSAEDMRPAPHSKAGLLQRRGRAGRTAAGVWHCLFTQEQFDALEYETAPEIARAPLSAVLLNAAASGVTDPASLRWLPPGPSVVELTRVRAELLALGAITQHGDPTEYGREINASRGEFVDTTLLINADIAGCVVEAATVLATKARNLDTGALLKWSRHWPAEAKVHVDDVHTTLLADCPDDLEAICRIFAYWEAAGSGGNKRAWCERHHINSAALASILDERARLLTGLQSKMKTEQLRPLDLRLLPRLRAVVAWTYPNGVYATERAGNTLALTPCATARSDADVIAAMADGQQAVVDSRSWAHRQAPAHLVLLDRSRVTVWSSPLQPPRTVQQGALCAAVDPAVLDGVTSLHNLLITVELGTVPAPPLYLPGDRVRVVLEGDRVRALQMLPGIPDPTIELGDDEDDFDESGVIDEHSGQHSQIDGEEDVDDAYISPWEEPAPDGPKAGPSRRIARGAERAQGGGNRPERRPAPAGNDLPRLAIDGRPEQASAPSDIVTLAAVRGTYAIGSYEDDGSYEAFVEAHPAGSDLTVRIEEVRSFPRDRRPLILARDTTTGLQVMLDGGTLGTGLRYAQVGQLAVGIELGLGVDGYDRRHGVRHLSQTAATIAALGRLKALASGARRSTVVNGMLVDADEGRLWVQVTPDRGSTLPADPPPIVLSVEAGRLPAMNGLSVGRSVRLKLSWGRRSSWTQRVRGIEPGTRLPAGPWEAREGAIVVREIPTVADWTRMVRWTEQALGDSPELAARLRTAVASAARRLLSPRVEIIDHVAIEEMGRSGRAEAKIVAATAERVVIQLPHGGTQTVPGHELSWGQQQSEYQPGDTVTAYISSADPVTGHVRAELRDPAANPYLKLSVGGLCATRVVERTARDEGFVVLLLDHGVYGWLPDREACGAVLGDSVRVRVLDVDPARARATVSCYLFDDTMTLPARLGVLWAPPPGQQNPRLATLRRLVGDDIVLRLQPDPNGDADVRVRSQSPMRGAGAADIFAWLARAKLHYIALPGYDDPIRADDWALLRRIAPVAGALTRRQHNGKSLRALAVAATTDDEFVRAFTTVTYAYPQQWVSEGFRYRREHLQAARDAVKAAGLDTWIGIDMGDQLPRATVIGTHEQVGHALGIAHGHGLTIPMPGGWRPDPRITWL